jgi:hypothetical protein
MFYECVNIKGIRLKDNKKYFISQTLKVSVFTNEIDDVIADSMDSNIMTLNLLVSNSDWSLVDSIQRGDEIIRAKGDKYKVQDVIQDELFGWVIKARSIK